MSDVRVVARYAVSESLRRRVLLVVVLLTAAFLGLYAWGADEAFEEVEGLGAIPVDEKLITGSTLLGLAMFVTLFLGVVLASFLSLGVIRGDAERGLLQPLVVRPVGRDALLVGRLLAAGGLGAVYTGVVYGLAVVLTGLVGDYWPPRPVLPGVALAGGVVIVAALALLGSTLLSATANGIATFMVFGAGLTAGLLGQIGAALDAASLETIAEVVTWALPFEALYQDGLSALTEGAGALESELVQLGPFGGAQAASTGLLWGWAVVYVAGVTAAAVARFRRMDL